MKQGKPVLEATEFRTKTGAIVKKQKCQFTPGALQNNVHQVPVTIDDHSSMVTERCKRGQAGQEAIPPTANKCQGPLRDCGFRVKDSNITCVPGQKTQIRLGLQNHDGIDKVVRICETSRRLTLSMACEFQASLANAVISPGHPSTLTFQCPTARDDPVESGGVISLLVGHIFPEWQSGPPAILVAA